MKFRCPRCGRLFPASRSAGTVSCPGCGQELSVKPRLKKTCPECDMQYPVERTTCPECGANYRLAGLQQQERPGTQDDVEGAPVAYRGCLLVAGIATFVVGVILFARAQRQGYFFRLPMKLMVIGVAIVAAGLVADDIAAKARAARRARRGLPPKPPDYQGPSQ